MARGWESKSVEDQMDSAHRENDSRESAAAHSTRKDKNKQSHERDLLLLARANTVQKLEATENARYREQLTRAIADLDARIAAFDKSR
jgi:hypothetical protein